MSIKQDSGQSNRTTRFNRSGSHKTTATKVNVGEGMVSLKRDGQSDLVIAKILGRRTNEEEDCEILWLDRLVHTDGEEFVGFNASGAISTVLIRGLAQVTLS